MSIVEDPAHGIGPWGARDVEQPGEAFLVLGLIGADFAGVLAMLAASPRLRFAYRSSPSGILDTGGIALASPAPGSPRRPTCSSAGPGSPTRAIVRPPLTLEDGGGQHRVRIHRSRPLPRRQRHLHRNDRRREPRWGDGWVRLGVDAQHLQIKSNARSDWDFRNLRHRIRPNTGLTSVCSSSPWRNAIAPPPSGPAASHDPPA